MARPAADGLSISFSKASASTLPSWPENAAILPSASLPSASIASRWHLAKLASGCAPALDVSSGESATATASRKFGDGSYNLTVNATLPDPVGNVYQVWIVGGDESHLAGDMQGSGKSWSLSFNDVDDYSNLDGIWISREITKQDNKPEKHILEGSF